MAEWQLAQINVARLRAPIDDPTVAEFVAGLEPVNALADTSPGFVWRLQTEDGNATAMRPYDDELVIVNMSVWASLDQLADFVYRSAHREFLRAKRAWFERMVSSHMALWWMTAGAVPSVEEGVARLETLRSRGPSPAAFTFREPFPAPGASDHVEADDRNTCSA
jgi:hypothetical protein